MARRKRKKKITKTDSSRQHRRAQRPALWIASSVLIAAAVAAFVLVLRWMPGDRGYDPSSRTRPAATGDLATNAEIAEIPVNSGTSWQQLDNPSADGWDTEVFHDKAKKQLDALGALLANPNQIEPKRLESLVTADFSCGPFVPDRLDEVFEDAVFVVQRPAIDPQSTESQSPVGERLHLGNSYRGTKGLADAMSRAVTPLITVDQLRFEAKVYRVQPSEEDITTHQYVSLSGRTSTGKVEQHATWVIRWVSDRDSTAPRIQRIDVEAFERVYTKVAGGPLFADCTQSVLGQNSCYNEQLLWGVNHWLQRIPDRDMLTRFGKPGIALGDVNGDGLEDLYLCQEPGLPNRLFLQQPNGTLRDVSDDWGVNWLEDSRSALLVDLDNDGDQDLVVAMVGSLILASNDNERRFQIQSVLPTSEATTSLTAVDYDQDGRLDLYVCAYNADRSWQETGSAPIGTSTARFVYHDANNGGANSLFRNATSDDGNWKFADVTHQLGLDVNNRRWSFAAAWEDVDNDGDQDLYVANDYGVNNLFRNDVEDGQPTFVDVAAEHGAEDVASGMSVTWGDYDRDGWMDVYVSNMFSSAGNRITFQSKFKPELSIDLRRRFQRFARGNTLLRNLGDLAAKSGPRFDDVSEAAGVTMGRWAWGSNFLDLNNDGWDDLIVANGFLTTEDSGDL